jgi:hypothetical protein
MNALFDALDGYSELLRRHQIAMKQAIKVEQQLRKQIERQQTQMAGARVWLKVPKATAKKGKATA